jgi:hypothetical protein
MQELGVFSVLALCLGVFTFFLINGYRIKIIKKHLHLAFQDKTISEIDYRNLLERYNGIFWFLESFPDEFEYPNLYSNLKFKSFKFMIIKVMKYLGAILVLLFLLAMFFSPKEYSYP